MLVHSPLLKLTIPQGYLPNLGQRAQALSPKLSWNRLPSLALRQYLDLCCAKLGVNLDQGFPGGCP